MGCLCAYSSKPLLRTLCNGCKAFLAQKIRTTIASFLLKVRTSGRVSKNTKLVTLPTSSVLLNLKGVYQLNYHNSGTSVYYIVNPLPSNILYSPVKICFQGGIKCSALLSIQDMQNTLELRSLIDTVVPGL